MTKNSKNSKEFNSILNTAFDHQLDSILNDADEAVKDNWAETLLGNYEHSKLTDAINLYDRLDMYFDNDTLNDIFALFEKDLEKKGGSIEARETYCSLINYYEDFVNYRFHYDNYNVGEIKKIMIQEIDDLYYSCISLIIETSMNVKKSTSKNSVDDYYKSFLDNIAKLEKFVHNIDESDVVFIMFWEIVKCKRDGGDFHMIDTLYNKLGEYLEENYKY